MPSPRPAPRPKRTDEAVTSTLGKGAKGSRQQADTSANRAQAMHEDGPPLTVDGRPMVKIEASAAELLPTGQFANVSVGPVKVSIWIDPQDPEPIPEDERNNIAAALNLICEITEVDVVAVQRNLVLESMQNQNAVE